MSTSPRRRGTRAVARTDSGRDLTPRNARRRRGLQRPAPPPSRVRPRRAAVGALGTATRPALRALILAALLAALVATVRQPAFAARSVEVSGLHHLDRGSVLRAAGLTGHPALFTISPDRAEAAIAADPYVRAVTVTALLPAGVRVSVVEWQPVAVLQAGSDAWLLTEVGGALGPVRADAPGLPLLRVLTPPRPVRARDHLVSGRLLADLIRLQAAFPGAYGLSVSDFQVDAGGRLVADTAGPGGGQPGPRILFGQMVTEEQIDSLDAKLGALAALRQSVDLAHSGFDYVNVMNPAEPATHVPSPSPAASPSPGARRATPKPAPSPSH